MSNKKQKLFQEIYIPDVIDEIVEKQGDNIVIKVMGMYRNTDTHCLRIFVIDKSLDADEITKQAISALNGWMTSIEEGLDIKCVYEYGRVEKEKPDGYACNGVLFYEIHNAYFIK